jgi:dTDP-4-amino-4,6-dideoxygalactose transaminase
MSSVASSQESSVPSNAHAPLTCAAGSTAQLFDFLDLRAQFGTIRAEVMAAVTRVMESQHFILGDEVRLFEEELSAMLGAKHAIACASGSDALVLALMAADIGPGHEVITTPFTFVATAGSIARVGARPVFVDIDPTTFNIDVNKIEAAITARTRAIMPVHLFGLAADMDTMLHIVRGREIAVVEDAAQAIGARYRGRCVGTIGTFGCFSFFPSKNLGGAGDGGLITTEDSELAGRLRLIRVHGSKKKYHHEVLGTNSRLDSLQAAILRVKRNHLEDWTLGREARSNSYRRLFEAANLGEFVTVPAVAHPDYRHVYNQFSIRSRHRDELRDFMRGAGVPTEIYYPVPLHLQPAFSYLGYREGDFPESELASREVLALPVYPELSETQQQAVVEAITEFYQRTN